MRFVIVLAFAMLSGCTSSFDRARAMRTGVPDWYAAKRVEIAGESYGQIRDIPNVTPDQAFGQSLSFGEAETRAALAAFQADARAALPQESPEEMLAWARRVRNRVTADIPEANFLTDADVALLKARFDVPRAQR